MSSLPLPVLSQIAWLALWICGQRQWDGEQRAAFFCSNRGSNTGCGRTCSTLWSHLLAFSSLSAGQLFELLQAYAATGSAHGAWTSTSVPVSLTTVARWLGRWKRGTAHVRSHLVREQPPPGGSTPDTSRFTLRYLLAVFGDPPCPVSAFQERFQCPILP